MKIPPLPSYIEYRSDFLSKGIQLPLNKVKYFKEGILNFLPSQNSKTGWPWNEEVNPEIYNSEINWPKITVVSPSYNQGKYFEETIRSVLLQNYPNLEYIVMDGGSKDETVSILEKYTEYISYWQSEKDRGQSHAINLGFSLASGDIYCWMNSDDYFTKGALKTAALTMISAESQFVYGNCLIRKNQIFEPFYPNILFDRYLCIPGLAQPSTFWDAKIHQPVWEELHCTLDFELWMRMLRGKKKKYVNEFLSVAREHSESKTHSTETALKTKWQEDHDKQWKVHGPIPWHQYNWENRYVQKLFRTIPFLKNLF